MDGRTLKVLKVIDEYSQLVLAIRVSRRCRAAELIDAIEASQALLNANSFVDGQQPRLHRHRLAGMLHLKCLLHRLHPGRFTMENSLVESFNSRFSDESLNIELFTSVREVKLLAEQHRIEYNTYRPHSALQGRAPLDILQQWKAA